MEMSPKYEQTSLKWNFARVRGGRVRKVYERSVRCFVTISVKCWVFHSEKFMRYFFTTWQTKRLTTRTVIRKRTVGSTVKWTVWRVKHPSLSGSQVEQPAERLVCTERTSNFPFELHRELLQITDLQNPSASDKVCGIQSPQWACNSTSPIL